MSNPNLKPSLRAPVIAAIPSASQSVGTATIAGAVDMGVFINVMAVATVGAFGASATATLKFEQSTLEDFSMPKTSKVALPLRWQKTCRAWST